MGELLERDAEVRALQDAAADARAGRGRVVLLEGPAGIGKSALLETAGDGLVVLRARGSEVERDVAFGVARQLLERPVARLDEAARSRVLAGAAKLAEPLVLPTAATHAPGPDAATARHGLFWTVANLADEAPVALLVDDLHWGDDASLRWLAYLATRLDDVPALLVLAHRSGERGVPDDVRAAIGDAALLLAPAELTADGTRRLLEADSPGIPEAVAEACHRATGGNPLLVRELARATGDGAQDPEQVARVGAVALADRVTRRVAARSPDAVALAISVAVLGPGCELRTAARVAGLDGPAAARAADELVASGLLAPGRPLAFVHPIVGTAVAEGLGEHDRAARHRDAAAVLDAEGAAAGRVAAHLLQAPPDGDPWVVDRLVAAGEAALAAGAPVEAHRLLQRALDERPAAAALGHALMLAGSAAWLGGAPDDAEPLLRAAHTEEIGEDDRFAAGAQLAQVLLWQSRADDALVVLRDLAQRTTDPSLSLELEAERAAAELAQGKEDPVEVCRRVERLHDAADPSLPGAGAIAGALAYAMAVTGMAPASRVRDLLTRLPLEDTLSVRGIGTMFLPSLAGLAAVASDDLDRADVIGAVLREAARRRGSRILELASHGAPGYAALVRGELADAEAHYRAALDLARSTGLQFIVQGMGAYLARTLADRGRFADALELVDVREVPGMGGRTTIFSAMHILAATGQWSRVAELAQEAELSVTGTRATFPSTPWRLPAAHAHLALDQADRARELLAEQRRITDAWGSPRLDAATLRAEARVASADDAIDHLRRAVDRAAGTQAKLELARSLVALGEALRRAGHRVDCREPLREGLDLADRCGAAPLAERAAEELRATGAHPRKVLLRGAAALTASELRTCRLAAQGLTNREIAQELWVTRKTVETHLSRAFRKLDVSSRDQLAAALDGGQPAPAAA